MRVKMRRVRWFCGIVILTSPCVAAPALDDAVRLQEIFRDYELWRVEDDPSPGMIPTRLTEFSPASYARRREVLLEFRQRLDDIDPLTLRADDRVSLEVLDHLVLEGVGTIEHGRHVLPIGPLHGVQTMGETWFGHFRFATAEDAARYVILVDGFPRHVDGVIDLLREGLQRGRTLSRPAADRVVTQLDELLTSELEPFSWPFVESWERLAEAERNMIWDRFHRRTLPRVRAAYTKLHRFMIDEYRDSCPEQIAFGSQPGGDDFYAHELRILTTSSMTACELHELGVNEVARVQSLLVDAIRRTEFVNERPDHAELDSDELCRAFREFILNERRFYFEDGEIEAILIACRDIAKRVDPWLPSLFRKLPRLTFGIDQAHAERAFHSAMYLSGSLETGAPAMVLVSAAYIADMPRFMLPTMVLHEGSPGHHLQIALADEMADVPRFRLKTWIPGYGEGWAMYAEELGTEMHLYADPYDNVGRLHSQLWRASRLVIDTGVHARGWTREEAARYLRERTLLDERAIDHELLRVMSWPGQLATYTVGLLEFRALREEAERMLGDAFDVREFHDVLLRDGCVPLPTLRWRVLEWIEDQTQP